MEPVIPVSILPEIHRYLDLLDRWNRTHALTALPPDERHEELILDSASLIPFLENLKSGSRIVDFGTGMGIPSVVLALARPDLEVYGLDRAGKKIAFVRQVRLELGLNNLHPVLGTAESIPPIHAELGVAKAVGPLPLLAGWWERHRAPGGAFLAMKGAGWESEPLPKGWDIQAHTYELPTRGCRVILELKNPGR
jgi:16S rRNA (guanine527-N7)-methyltransferase